MSNNDNKTIIMNKNIGLNDVYLINENQYQQKLVKDNKAIFQIVDIETNKVLKEIVIEKIKYIVIAGSSGGHILPALAYINNLSLIKDPNNILFITNEIGKKYLGKIESNKINKIILKSKNKFFFILNLLLKVSFIFLSNRRIILIGFGGFITTPVLIISKLFNIFLLSFNKIYIHEQNVIYGLANKINYFIAKNAFISFPKDNMRSKEIFVGNFFINRNKFREKLDHNFINVLLMGGSAGSLDLNNMMLKEITNFNRAYLKNIKFFIQIPESHIKVLKKNIQIF